MRYPSLGDYWETEDGVLCIRVVSLKNPWHEWLVFFHELIEYILIKRAGVQIADIDRYDMNFEKNRHKGNQDDPGNNPSAPYYKQHQWAIVIERLLATVMKINWMDYEKFLKEVYE